VVPDEGFWRVSCRVVKDQGSAEVPPIPSFFSLLICLARNAELIGAIQGHYRYQP